MDELLSKLPKNLKRRLSRAPAWRKRIVSSLRLKVVALVLVLCLLPLGLVSFLHYHSTSRSLLENVENRLEAAAAETANTIDVYLNGRRNLAISDSKIPTLAEFLKSRDKGDRAKILYSFERTERYNSPYFLSAALLDAKGNVVLERNNALKGENESTYDFFRFPKRNLHPFVSPIQFNETSGSAFFVVSAPVLESGGEFMGVLRVLYDAQVFQRLITSKNGLVGAKTHGILLNENNLVLGYGDLSEDANRYLFNLATPLSLERVEELRGQGELPRKFKVINDPKVYEAINGTELAHGEIASATAPLQNMPWKVAFLMPTDAFIEPLKTQAIQGIFLLLGIATMVVLFAVWTARVLFNPMRNLTEMARQVAAGDLHVKMPVESRDEIGTLAATFNKMTHQLQEREEERSLLLAREQKAREEAERANKLKDEFLATLSHELRTPMAAILGWINLLKNIPGSVEFEEGLRMIERNAWAETQLVDDLIDLSRIACGKIELNRDALDFNAILHEVMETVTPSAQAKELSIELEIGDPNACILGDWNRLRQVFLNLLMNAIKFTPEKGRILLRQNRTEDEIIVSIIDTGIGIAKKDLERIFTRFMQVDSSTTREFGGMGLGLPISQHLVELHGGRIYAESEGEGRGATFTVELPILITVEPET